MISFRSHCNLNRTRSIWLYSRTAVPLNAIPSLDIFMKSTLSWNNLVCELSKTRDLR